MAKTVIIHGVHTDISSSLTERLCKHFGCSGALYNWSRPEGVRVGWMHLTRTYNPLHGGKTVTVDEQFNVIGETIIMSFDAMIEQMMSDADTELNHHKARNESKGKLIRRLRGRLQDISDHIEDEGDRKYFGSTNDADDLTDLVHAMDRWRWDDILSKDEGHTDPYADLREQRARAEKAEAEVARLKTLLNDCNATRRYAVFAGAQCYPCGGAADLIGFATTLDDAVTMVDGALKQAVCISADWSHALDVSTGAVLPIPGYSDIRSYVGSPLRSDIDPETGEWSV